MQNNVQLNTNLGSKLPKALSVLNRFLDILSTHIIFLGNSTGHAKYAFPLQVSNDNSHKGELVNSKSLSYWLMNVKESCRGPEH